MLALSMYTFILVCSPSNLLLNEYDDDDDKFVAKFNSRRIVKIS